MATRALAFSSFPMLGGRAQPTMSRGHEPYDAKADLWSAEVLRFWGADGLSSSTKSRGRCYTLRAAHGKAAALWSLVSVGPWPHLACRTPFSGSQSHAASGLVLTEQLSPHLRRRGRRRFRAPPGKHREEPGAVFRGRAALTRRRVTCWACWDGILATFLLPGQKFLRALLVSPGQRLSSQADTATAVLTNPSC